jgi:hypothetical protein
MTAIQATEEDTSKFLSVLVAISEQQAIICKQLDELRLLMQLPSESVLKVLEGLLIPMGQSMEGLTTALKTQVTATES